MMVAKCVRKRMSVMIELVILILLSVQANDGAPISFFPSPPTILPHSSFVYNDFNSVRVCLKIGVKLRCASIKTTWPFPNFEYETCIFSTFENCLSDIKGYEDPRMFDIIQNCTKINCHLKLIISAIHRKTVDYVSCLLECCEEHIRNP